MNGIPVLTCSVKLSMSACIQAKWIYSPGLPGRAATSTCTIMHDGTPHCLSIPAACRWPCYLIRSCPFVRAVCHSSSVACVSATASAPARTAQVHSIPGPLVRMSASLLQSTGIILTAAIPTVYGMDSCGRPLGGVVLSKARISLAAPTFISGVSIVTSP